MLNLYAFLRVFLSKIHIRSGKRLNSYGSGTPGSGQNAKLIFWNCFQKCFWVNICVCICNFLENTKNKRTLYVKYENKIVKIVKIVKSQVFFIPKPKMFSKSKCTIADTAIDIYPKTFLETVSENQFCILAGSGCPWSVIIQPFSGSKMNFR